MNIKFVINIVDISNVLTFVVEPWGEGSKGPDIKWTQYMLKGKMRRSIVVWVIIKLVFICLENDGKISLAWNVVIDLYTMGVDIVIGIFEINMGLQNRYLTIV